jgi:hypothetical protein
MLTGLFEPALVSMKADGSPTYGPIAFQRYLAANFPGQRVRTADVISVDDPRQLRPELVSAQTMVLRLGQTSDGVTDFALVRPSDGIGTFFLADTSTELTETTFLSRAALRDLYVFELLPRHVEASLINLAFASGLLNHALQLDSQGGLPPPARGASTYTFEVRPHSTLDVVWRHHAGQVEIDALFVAERKQVDTLFIIEAKINKGERPVAKHKLVYPCLGLAAKIPDDIPIIPVYMKFAATSSGVVTTVTECTLPDPRKSLPAIDELAPIRSVKLRLPFQVL